MCSGTPFALLSILCHPPHLIQMPRIRSNPLCCLSPCFLFQPHPYFLSNCPPSPSIYSYSLFIGSGSSSITSYQRLCVWAGLLFALEGQIYSSSSPSMTPHSSQESTSQYPRHLRPSLALGPPLLPLKSSEEPPLPWKKGPARDFYHHF